MTEPNDQASTPNPSPETGSSPSWGETATGGNGAKPDTGTASGILESIRDAVEDLAEKATPAVREISAKAAELAAVAADRAAPLARKAGEVTADASGKLAEKSRGWASDLRSAVDGEVANDPTSRAGTASAPWTPEGTTTPKPEPGPATPQDPAPQPGPASETPNPDA
jgi:hypothetical protein